MSKSQSKDLQVLGQIRERRLSKAQQEKTRCLRALEAAAQAVEDAKRRYHEASSQADRRIAAIYDDLLSGKEKKIESVDKARLAESLIKEQLAAFKKDIADAESEHRKAEEKVAEASAAVVKLNAETEAINLLNEEQLKIDQKEQERVADEVIDEFAEQAASKGRRK